MSMHVQVITIEPGVYIPPAPVLNERAPGRYRGMGIRIEDEVLITEDGHEVRSALGRWWW
jgi:Xaa-Pro aminopeptidase